jgi:hypothetical protein
VSGPDLHDGAVFFAELEKCGGVRAELAAKYGIPESTLQNIHKNLIGGRTFVRGRWVDPSKLSGSEPSPAPVMVTVAAPVVLKPGEEVERDRTVLRLKTELRDLQRKYDAACKDSNVYEDILTVARRVMGKITTSEVFPVKPGTGAVHEDAILAWADWHGGEVVDYDVMQGYNCYDPRIMCRRAQYTVDHTLDILFGCHQGTTFGTLYVFDLGDSINGDHLPEQMATNALPVFEAMRLVTEVKSRALTELSAHIPVIYIAVPGNHGRRAQKMQWKLPTETADWLIGEMIADRVRGNERIQCIIPQSWTAGITVRGQNHVLNHGFAAAKGGYGGISWYSFQRADGQKTAIEAAHGKRVHHRWYGHIHQKAEVPMTDGDGEQHIVGSLKGGDEYAFEALNKYSEPSQKIVGCHDTYGVTWRYPLNVHHADDKPSRYEEIVE